MQASNATAANQVTSAAAPLHVVSTPKGVISDRKARELGVGGELLAEVF